MNDGKQSNYWSPDDDPSQVVTSPDNSLSNNSITEEPAGQGVTQLTASVEKNNKENFSTKEDISTPVDWVAPEYYAGKKNVTWYIVFVLVVAALMAISILVLESWSFAVLVAVMAVSLIVYSRRPATEVKYTLSVKQGLYVGDKLYNLQDFRAFNLVRDGVHNSIVLIPVKRFAPGLSVYFPSDAGEKIIDILASRLPMEETEPDFMDKIIKKLKI